MYDKHIIFPDSVRNTQDGSAITGWRLGARLPYYRGQILSAVEDVALTVDGEKVPRENVRFTVRGKTRTLDELETTYDERWEFGEVAEISVLQPGACDDVGAKKSRCASHEDAISDRHAKQCLVDNLAQKLDGIRQTLVTRARNRDAVLADDTGLAARRTD